MTTLDFGWTLVIIAWVFAAFIVIWGWWMGKRLDRLHKQVKDMNKVVDEMNRILDSDWRTLKHDTNE